MNQKKKDTEANDPKHDFELLYAWHDPAHCLMPGLFRSLKAGERNSTKLHVSHVFGETLVEIIAPEPFGVNDMRVLQGLMAMGVPTGKILDPSCAKTFEGAKLAELLTIDGYNFHEKSIVTQVSYAKLAREIGYESTRNTKIIRDSIERFFMTTVFVQSPDGKRQGFRLISQYASDEGGVYIALNPLLAHAILGDGKYVYIDMNEVRKLKGDPARLMHQRLCGWIDPGTSRKVGIDTLCGYVWPDKATESTMRKRRSRISVALEELVQLPGWSIMVVSDNVQIKRTSLRK